MRNLQAIIVSRVLALAYKNVITSYKSEEIDSISPLDIEDQDHDETIESKFFLTLIELLCEAISNAESNQLDAQLRTLTLLID
jgi:hypothetical protein